MIGLAYVAHYWDGVELWLSNLKFIFQVVIVFAIVVPLSIACAIWLLRIVEWFIPTHADEYQPEPLLETNPVSS